MRLIHNPIHMVFSSEFLRCKISVDLRSQALRESYSLSSWSGYADDQPNIILSATRTPAAIANRILALTSLWALSDIDLAIEWSSSPGDACSRSHNCFNWFLPCFSSYLNIEASNVNIFLTTCRAHAKDFLKVFVWNVSTQHSVERTPVFSSPSVCQNATRLWELAPRCHIETLE